MVYSRYTLFRGIRLQAMQDLFQTSGQEIVLMIWQDIVIMIACFGFAVALIPSIVGRQKPAMSSCLLTIVLLTAIAICFATLNLWLSFWSEITAIVAWGVLLFQKR